VVLDGGKVEAILESFDQFSLRCGHSNLGDELALGRGLDRGGLHYAGSHNYGVCAGDGVEEQQLGPGVGLTVTSLVTTDGRWPRWRKGQFGSPGNLSQLLPYGRKGPRIS